MKALLFLLLAGCASWKVPHAVGMRRVGGARLAACIAMQPCSYQLQCFADIRNWCVSNGQPKECGYYEPEGMACDTGVVPHG